MLNIIALILTTGIAVMFEVFPFFFFLLHIEHVGDLTTLRVNEEPNYHWNTTF